MFTKQFFEMIVKKYGNTSKSGGIDTKNPDNFFYLYSKDESDGNGFSAWEEDTFKLVPHDGVLEIVDLESPEGSKDFASDFITYEDIIRFNVYRAHGNEEAPTE